MAGNYGFYSRPKRRVYVLRGFDGCEPKTFTKSAPIAAGYRKGESKEIVSGDVVSIVGGEWVRGATENAIPYIALSDAADTDVEASDKLPALSCAGKFEIETARYDDGETYTEDSSVLRAHVNGATTTANEGLLTSAAAAGGDVSNDVIGYVSRPITALNATASLGASPYAPIDNTGFAGGAAAAQTFVHPQQENIQGPVSVMAFITNWAPVA